MSIYTQLVGQDQVHVFSIECVLYRMCSLSTHRWFGKIKFTPGETKWTDPETLEVIGKNSPKLKP
jgi:hypothetical protein